MGKKQKNCDPANSSDDHKGDWWDHVAYDPEHRLVLAVVPGARRRSRTPRRSSPRSGTAPTAWRPSLMTSDKYPDYTSAIGLSFGVPVTEPTTGPGRRPILPARRLPQGLTYATVHKQRQNDRVVGVEPPADPGDRRGSGSRLGRVGGEPDGEYVVCGAAARHRPRPEPRKTRKTYRFRKNCLAASRVGARK